MIVSKRAATRAQTGTPLAWDILQFAAHEIETDTRVSNGSFAGFAVGEKWAGFREYM